MFLDYESNTPKLLAIVAFGRSAEGRPRC